MQVQVNPEQSYTLTFTGNDIININAALQEIPAKFANPLSFKIAEQLAPKTNPVAEVTEEK